MKKRYVILLTVLALLLGACAGGGEEKSEGYQLYFTVALSQETSYGSALAAQPWEGKNDTPTAQELMEALLAGPTQEGLTSPFPRGVTVQKLEQKGDTVKLTLSEQYGGLTDISQTLADACIVMTLGQLPGVEAVEISTAAFWASRPASRTLRVSEIELDSLLP